MRISLEILRWSWRRVSWWEFLCKFSGWSWRRACWSERSEPFCQVIGKGSRHANWPGAETCLALAWQQIEVWHLLSGERQLERPPVELVQQEKANIEIFQWNWPGTFRANPKREKEGMMRCSATSQQMMSLISTAPPPHPPPRCRFLFFAPIQIRML